MQISFLVEENLKKDFKFDTEEKSNAAVGFIYHVRVIDKLNVEH